MNPSTSTKASVAISFMIVMLASGLRWNNSQRLDAARRNHERLMGEVTSLRSSHAGSETTVADTRFKRSDRANREAAVNTLATDFTSFLRGNRAFSDKNQLFYNDSGYQALQDRLDSLDSAELEAFLIQISKQPLQDTASDHVLFLALYRFSNKDPVATLNFIVNNLSGLPATVAVDQHIASSLSLWASRDPTTAADWERIQEKLHPDLINDRAKVGLLSGIAQQDPKLAFGLLSEIASDPKRQESMVRSIMFAASTNEERSKLFTAFRDHLSTIDDHAIRDSLFESVLGNLSQTIPAEGYDSAMAWITTATLSPSEAKQFAAFLPYSFNSDSGRWLEWIGQNVPAENASFDISARMHMWVESDYKAAGEWLATTPESATRTAAIGSYVETVSKYAPESAIPWALELPAGTARNNALKAIRRNWPNDPKLAKAAAEFANKYDLK